MPLIEGKGDFNRDLERMDRAVDGLIAAVDDLAERVKALEAKATAAKAPPKESKHEDKA